NFIFFLKFEATTIVTQGVNRLSGFGVDYRLQTPFVSGEDISSIAISLKQNPIVIDIHSPLINCAMRINRDLVP
ncbi:MAG: hypothetical protein WCS87_11635, partial [Methylococcaceae bacterium]